MLGEEFCSAHPTGASNYRSYAVPAMAPGGEATAGLGWAQPGTRMTATTSLLGGTERALLALLFFCLQGREEERLFL